MEKTYKVTPADVKARPTVAQAKKINDSAMKGILKSAEVIAASNEPMKQGIASATAEFKKLIGYEAQAGAVKVLAAAYLQAVNNNPFTRKPIEEKSAIIQIRRVLKAGGAELLKPPVSVSAEAERKRAARQPAQALKAGIKKAEKKPGEPITVSAASWDSMLIQSNAKIEALLEAMMPPSKLRDFQGAVAAFHQSQTGFIQAVKTLLAR